MKRFAVAVLKRLLVAVAVLLVLAGIGYGYSSVVGTSNFAAACVLLLVAWPWALPQIFLVVCLVWFIGQRAKSWSSS